MVVSTTPKGSTFKPMTEAAKEVAKFLREEYAKTPITKPELVQTMDSSKIIEGPSPSGSAVEKKVASLALLEPEIVETKSLPVLSISEVLLSEFSNEEFRNVLSFKASSFISDQTQSSFNFEIKGVRAIWDPSLSIPGTNRRGGFRCPVGTRYGGQITDRFGRSCGWGVARRIANQIADIGERLEQRDDDKRKRRLDRRNARMMRRLGGVPETGRIEGGLRGIADRLEGGAKPKPRRGGPGFAELGNRIADDLRPGSVLDRVVNGNRARGTNEDAVPEAEAPSARRPQNRRRDVVPETAPTPAPKPARRPAPAGRRPQARPQVAPQAENVDVLTARDASDAGETEDFKPYVLRKYGEYAKRVREIRAGGGNAGMLTRREWYAINKSNLRDAWKDAHGRSAPQDFEPPTPQARRPRNNRGRRKKATAQGAGRSASRKPTANDVPEPAPARPARPARRPRRSPDGRGFVTPVNGGAPAQAPDARVAREKYADALKKIENDPNHVWGTEFDEQIEQIKRNPDEFTDAELAQLVDLMEGIGEERNQENRRRVQMGFPNNADDAAAVRKIRKQISDIKDMKKTSSSVPAEAPNPPTPPSPPRGGKKKTKSLNRAKDRHEAGLPKLENGKFDEVAVGNKNIRTKAQALAYQGPLNDIPDKFLEAVLMKRSDVVKDRRGVENPNSALAKAMFGENGATPGEQMRDLRAIVVRIKKSRTKPNQLTAQDKEVLKKVKESGINYLSFYAGTGGANPTFHLFINDDGGIDGRGYLLKPKDNTFGNGANHAELFGAAVAEKMGFAHGQGRIITGAASIKALLELGPNFAEGQVDNVGNVANGADAIKDKESRLGAALLNGIMGAHDRHAGNGMVFDGNGALPIDFGRAFYYQNDTATRLLQYIKGGNYAGIDRRPINGYKEKYQAELRAGKTPQQAKDALRAELKQTLEQWRDGIKEVIDNGVIDNLNARFVNHQDIGVANVRIPDRKRTLNNRINIMASDEFVDLMMGEIVL